MAGSFLDWIMAGVLMATSTTITMGFFGMLGLFGGAGQALDFIFSLVYAALGGMIGISLVSMSKLLA